MCELVTYCSAESDLRIFLPGRKVGGKKEELGRWVRGQEGSIATSYTSQLVESVKIIAFSECFSAVMSSGLCVSAPGEKYVLPSWNWIIKWGLTWCWLFFMADLQYKLGLRHLLLNLLDFSRRPWMSRSLKISCWCYLFRLWCPFSVFPPLLFNNDIFQAESAFWPVALRAFRDRERGLVSSFLAVNQKTVVPSLPSPRSLGLAARAECSGLCTLCLARASRSACWSFRSINRWILFQFGLTHPGRSCSLNSYRSINVYYHTVISRRILKQGDGWEAWGWHILG